jgi:hypothetical protein
MYTNREIESIRKGEYNKTLSLFFGHAWQLASSAGEFAINVDAIDS